MLGERQNYNGISAMSPSQAAKIRKYFLKQEKSEKWPVDPNTPKDRTRPVLDPNAPRPQKSGKVAPHENNELQLVLEGKKPLATFEDGKSQDSLKKQWDALPIEQRNLLHVNEFQPKNSGRIIAVTRFKNRGLIHAYKELMYQFKQSRIKAADFHRLAGTMLGYSEADIDAFLKSDIRKTCQCGQCKN